jgi:hypothetical protein
MSRNLMPVYFNDKLNKKKLKMKKNAMDPVNFEEERKNDPKYKTELCKSFMQNNFCIYGNKCRFAHGYKELVRKKQINNYKQKTCNSFFNKGYCPYGNRCNFKHDERKIQEIGVPYYFSHLISLHFPQLKTCRRLNVFQNINNIKYEGNDTEEIVKQPIEETVKESLKESEKENIIINSDINNNEIEKTKSDEEKEEQKEENKKDELSLSFSSEKSSEATSLNDSPYKEKEKIEFESYKINDFMLEELNFEFDFFSHEN